MKTNLNNIKTMQLHGRTKGGDDKKFQYLKSIKEASFKKVGINTVVNIAQGDGRQCEIIYEEGTSNIKVNGINRAGRRSKISTYMSGQRLCINRNNTTVCVNELIYQAGRIANGLPVELGSYNHYLPSKFLEILNMSEVFSVWSGDICGDGHNLDHWNLCERVYNDTGIMCSFKSYTMAYELKELKRTITEQDVKKYRHIDRGLYLEVLE